MIYLKKFGEYPSVNYKIERNAIAIVLILSYLLESS